MESGDRDHLERLRWENTARQQRPAIAARLAAAAGCSASDIHFMDREQTENCLALLRQQTQEAVEHQLPDRSAAIARIHAEFSGLAGAAVLLPLTSAASSGAVAMSLQQILEHLPSLLGAEYENLAFMTQDGCQGGIIGIQESIAPDQPRWLQVWHLD